MISQAVTTTLDLDRRQAVDLDALFNTLYTPLHRYCLGLTGDGDAAHDAAQEAFVRLVRKDVEGQPAALKVWLFKVATHIIRDRYRVDKNRERLLNENPPLIDRVEGPEGGLERAEAIDLVRKTLSQLTARDRELLLMRYQGFSYREMAEALGVASSSIGTLLSRAQRRFAQLHNGEEPTHD